MLSRNPRTSVLWHVLAWSNSIPDAIFVESLFVVVLSLPRETFGSAAGTRPMIKSPYKVSSETMINHNRITTCCKNDSVCKPSAQKWQIQPSYGESMKFLEFAIMVCFTMITERLEILKSMSPPVQSLSSKCLHYLRCFC